MTARAKLLARIVSGASDQTIPFEELVALLKHLGFELRVAGSHHIFAHGAMAEIMNLQPRRDGTAKPYQVRQVRLLLTRYKMAGDTNAS